MQRIEPIKGANIAFRDLQLNITMKASPYPEARVGANFDDIVHSAAQTTSNYAQDLSPYSVWLQNTTLQ